MCIRDRVNNKPSKIVVFISLCIMVVVCCQHKNRIDVYKRQGVERACVITDALACAASECNVAFDPRVIIEDGVCKLADRSALAGSVATMDRLIRTLEMCIRDRVMRSL